MARVLIIEPGFSCLALLPTSKQLGHDVITFSASEGDRRIPEPYKKDIDQLITVDTNNITKIEEEARKIFVKAPFQAIIPGSEYHVCIAAILANKFDLPACPIESVNALRDKYFMRQYLANAGGIRMPKYYFIKSESDLKSGLAHVGAPAIIKPTGLAGGLHVKKVANLQELVSAYAEIHRINMTEMGNSALKGVMIEEFIGGKPFSVEGVVSASNITILSITEKISTPGPYFVEMGHIVQANLDDNTSAKIITYVNSVIKALKMQMGVFHLELKLDEAGPVIIEIAGRLPGDHICDLIKMSRGVDFAEIMVRTHLGEKISLSLSEQGYSGIRYFSSSDAMIGEIENPAVLKELPGFKKFEVILAPGTANEFPNTFLSRYAYAIFNGPSYKLVHDSMQKAASLIKLSSFPTAKVGP
jgi:biotin carboxylase